MPATPSIVVYRFGPFELNKGSGDLTRNGLRLRLQDKPRCILIALVTRSGETMARSELQSLLWPADNFVDFEDGLNTAMRKLRETLGDDPVQPRYIETVRGHGYRFIAAVREESSPPLPEEFTVSSTTTGVTAQLSAAAAARAQQPTKVRGRKALQLFLAGAAVCAVVAAAWWFLPAPPPRLVRVTQITTQSKIDFLVKPVTEGALIFYLERSGGHWNAMETSLQGGVAQPIAGLPPNTRVMDLSPDRATYLLGSFASRGSPASLWLMPVQGGAPVRLNDIESGEAVWQPDGTHIVYARENELWKVAADGTDARRLASLAGAPNWLAWSPDGRRLRFTGSDANGRISMWEMNQDGSNLHRFALNTGPDVQQCCGEWSGDGRYFIFTSTRGEHSSIWAIREQAWHVRRTPRGPFEVIDWPTGTGALCSD